MISKSRPEPRSGSHSSLEPRYDFKATLSLEVIPIALLLYPGLSLVVKFTVSPDPRIDFYTALLSFVLIYSSSNLVVISMGALL